MPVDILKLDKSFARLGTDNDEDVSEPGSNEALVHAVVSLASAIGLTVVAEGLETDAMIDRFRSAGVELGQGYGLARPMSAADAENWIRASAVSDRLIA